jgi:hypothetical protein
MRLIHAKWWSLEDHGDGGGDHKVIKCSTSKTRKRKTKSYKDQGKGINKILVLVIETPRRV